MIALRRSRIAHAFSWIAAFATVAAFAIAAGCGGSGSSGFDLAESAAIERVTSDQECEDFEGLLICPADSSALLPTPTAPPDPTGAPTGAPTELATRSVTPQPTVAPQATATPPASTTVTTTPVDGTSPTPLPATATPVQMATATPSPTVIAAPGVITQVGESNDVQTCESSGGNTCTLRFAFTPVGFSPEAAFRVASRPVGAETAWRIADPTPAGVAGAPFTYVAPLEVDLAEAAAGSPSQPSLQVVVLAFERDPGPVPETVDRLSDTGADAAFAVAPFAIIVE